jgi:hypothetical protein
MVSLAAVLSLGFLLLVSLLLTTALAVGGKYFAPYHLPETAMHAVGSAVSFGMITLLFAMMFKWLPDTHVAWRDAAVSRYCNRQVPEEATLHNVGADTGTWLSARRDVGPLASRSDCHGRGGVKFDFHASPLPPSGAPSPLERLDGVLCT